METTALDRAEQESVARVMAVIERERQAIPGTALAALWGDWWDILGQWPEAHTLGLADRLPAI